ncbi:hypothetical protein KKA27_01360, partial [Patescibacteria group bacterium]|nr:hypothetical protein [Patescibacteria group bacterium]
MSYVKPKTTKGSIYCEGQALMTAVIFFLLISVSVIGGMSFSILSGVKFSLSAISSKESYFLAEAATEDIVFRITKGKNYSSNEVIALNNSFATTTTENVSGEVELISTASVNDNVRKIKVTMTNGDGASFHYGVQSGEGGMMMDNLAQVTGNAYSAGPISASNDNEIRGDVISAGPFGSVSGVYATGTVYAHNISDSEIEGDAYYQNIFNTTVWGELYPDSEDKSSVDLPISDELIEEWKSAATSSVITSPCPYVVKSDITLGPVKIACDLEIEGSPTVTFAGPVWVEGDITFQNNAIVRVDPSVGGKSVPIIADNPADRLTSGRIILKNNVEFYGSGEGGSYVLMISQNDSAENGGDEVAIEIINNVLGDLLIYAGHGKISVQNDATLKEVTAHTIHLSNLADIVYETGLANLLFDSGPSGGMSV